METSSPNHINLIAQELDCGNVCYYNPKTNDIVGIPSENHLWDEADFEETFGDELKKINNPDYIKFEVPESYESFEIMEQFILQLPESHFKTELENMLQKPKPFRHFKYTIESSDYRASWFEFKIDRLKLRVTNQLEEL